MSEDQQRYCGQCRQYEQEIERLRAENPIGALEAWNNADKSRSVKIDIDDGYGATCWRVELRQGTHAIYCSETNFIVRHFVDALWHEHNGNLYCCVVDGDAEDFEWPGLAATITKALECAEKFWRKGGGDDA